MSLSLSLSLSIYIYIYVYIYTSEKLKTRDKDDVKTSILDKCSKCYDIQHLWNCDFPVTGIRKLHLVCALVYLATLWTDLINLSLGILYHVSCCTFCSFITTHIIWCVWQSARAPNLKKQQDTLIQHFSHHIHNTAASWWNSDVQWACYLIAG